MDNTPSPAQANTSKQANIKLPTVQELSLWKKLSHLNLTKQSLPPNSELLSTWYIRLLLGFAGWISACFLFGLIGLMLSDFLFDDGSTSALFIGFACCTFAFINFKAKRSKDFTEQLALAFNMCGQFLIGVGIWNLFDYNYSAPKDMFYLTLFITQLILMFLMPNFISRVLSCLFALTALYVYLTSTGANALFQPTIFWLFLLVWSKDLAWGKNKDLWEPIGYGLALTLLLASGYFASSDILDFLTEISSSSILLIEYLPLISICTTSLGFAFLLNTLRKEHQVAIYSKGAVTLIIATLVLCGVSYLIPGASVGFALIIIGYAKQKRLLLITGVLSLLSFTSWYYYSLQWTLLYKSLVLIGLGITFAALLGWMHFASRLRGITLADIIGRYKLDKTTAIGLAVMVLVLVAVNNNIYQREQILAHGKIVLLELAPVDPRSLMQGDYMRLRFEIESQLIDKKETTSNVKNPTQGLFIVDLDKHSVGSFNGIYQDQALTATQTKMQFRIRKQRIQLATHAFFFEEGTAELYEAAEYGEFRVAENGELLLNNLRDKDYKVIGYNRPNN